jgi:hypothetical protein
MLQINKDTVSNEPLLLPNLASAIQRVLVVKPDARLTPPNGALLPIFVSDNKLLLCT